MNADMPTAVVEPAGLPVPMPASTKSIRMTRTSEGLLPCLPIADSMEMGTLDAQGVACDASRSIHP